jgi:hypothetical protein
MRRPDTFQRPCQRPKMASNAPANARSITPSTVCQRPCQRPAFQPPIPPRRWKVAFGPWRPGDFQRQSKKASALPLDLHDTSFTAMTDKASPTKRKLVPHIPGPVDKRRRKRGLTRTVRIAIDAMVYERCTRAQACERAGFTERALYLALEKPEVAAYWNAAVQVLRTGERARNVVRLCEIRDAADNLPAVNAIKALEHLADEAETRPVRGSVPGFVIVIAGHHPVSQAPAIDITPSADELSAKDE